MLQGIRELDESEFGKLKSILILLNMQVAYSIKDISLIFGIKMPNICAIPPMSSPKFS